MAVAERDVWDARPDETQTMRWTKDQYRRMSEIGLFGDMRVELIEGEIIPMPAIGSRHFTSVLLVSRALQSVFTEGYLVVPQNGFDANPHSEPQPDIAVYPGGIRDYTNALPTQAALIVEVSDSTLRADRTVKASLYAAAGVAEYWIVNLREEVLEVRRQPLSDPSSPVAYQSLQTLRPVDTVSPLAAPDAVISVADLLP
jgi:Uma2 family endonuclease